MKRIFFKYMSLINIEKIRRVLRYIVLIESIIILILLVFILADYILPYVAEPRTSGSIVIFDAEDIVENNFTGIKVVVVKGFMLTDLFSLPKLDADLVIIVAHGFIYEDNEFILGTSEEPSVFYPVFHPLYVVEGAVVRGKTFDGEQRIGVSQKILDYIPSPINKPIIMLTCGFGNVSSFAEKLVEKGASYVAYYNGTVKEEYVNDFINEIINSWKNNTLRSWLESNNFVVIERETG